MNNIYSINQKWVREPSPDPQFNRTTGKVNAKINRVGAETHNYVGKATTSWLNREYENQ